MSLDVATLVPVFLAVLALFALAAAAMGVGAMFGRKCLRGSCGGPDADHDERIACDDCPNRRRSAGPQ